MTERAQFQYPQDSKIQEEITEEKMSKQNLSDEDDKSMLQPSKHSKHYYDYDRNGKLSEVKIEGDAPWIECMDGFKIDDCIDDAKINHNLTSGMKAAVGFIDKYDDALRELAKSEKEELKEELEAKKKENFQSIAVSCMAEYTRAYGEMPENDSWMFLEAEYYGTGEGQTLCLQMTQANPRGGDNGDFDRTLPYPDDYKPINTKQYRAVRGFHKLFGTWHLHGLRFHTREAFFNRYANQLPASLVKLKDQKCFLEYHSELHYNFA